MKKNGNVPMARSMYARGIGWTWLKLNRPDVVAACRQESYKKFPAPAKVPGNLPKSLQSMK